MKANRTQVQVGRGVLTVEELGRLSEDLDAYMDWAQIWHRQAGGYTASDTQHAMMNMERWARRLKGMTGRPERERRLLKSDGL